MSPAQSTEKITFRLLGTPCAFIGQKHVSNFRSNRVPALIGLLASNPKPWQRERVAATLWPDSMSAEAKHNLRQTILYAKQIFGDHVLNVTWHTIELNPECDSDIQLLHRANDQFQSRDDLISNSERAATAYGGEFLDNYTDEWITAVRSQCNRMYVNALLTLADHHLALDPKLSSEFAQRAIESEPFMDRARACKIRALLAVGEESLAHQELKSYKSFLHHELGIEPSRILNDVFHTSPTEIEPLRSEAGPIEEPSNDAVRFLLSGHRPKRGLELALAMVPYWIAKGKASEGIPVLHEILDLTDLSLEASLVHAGQIALSELLSSDGKLYDAREILSRVIPLITDDRVRFRAFLNYSRLFVVAYQAKAAQPFIAEALSLSQLNGSTEDKIDALRCAAEVAYMLGDLDLAEAHSKSCAELALAINDWHSFSSIWLLIATIRLRSDQKEEARNAMERALKELDNKHSHLVSNIRVRFNRLLEELGDTENAEQGYRNGISEARGFGDQMGLAISLTYLGDLLTCQGRYDDALPLHAEALSIRQLLNEPLGEATSLRGIGRIQLAKHQLEEANRTLQESSRIFLACDSTPGHASALLELARVAKASGSQDMALRIARRTRDLLAGMSVQTLSTFGPSTNSPAEQVNVLIDSLASKS